MKPPGSPGSPGLAHLTWVRGVEGSYVVLVALLTDQHSKWGRENMVIHVYKWHMYRHFLYMEKYFMGKVNGCLKKNLSKMLLSSMVSDYSLSTNTHNTEMHEAHFEVTCISFTRLQCAECKYCRVPEGWGLHKTARPPSRDYTRSVNPLVRAQVYN